MNNIKEALFNTGESAKYDNDVLQKRVVYAKQIREKVKNKEISQQEATKLLNEYGKKNNHWLQTKEETMLQTNKQILTKEQFYELINDFDKLYKAYNTYFEKLWEEIGSDKILDEELWYHIYKEIEQNENTLLELIMIKTYTALAKELEVK
jgi:hypothetical protein